MNALACSRTLGRKHGRHKERFGWLESFVELPGMKPDFTSRNR